jgi:hypothetical protein
VEDLNEENRWPGSAGYVRYCTAAERLALNRWVDRQLQPDHAEHGRFFAVVGAHGSSDDPSLLLPSGEAPSHAREPRAPSFVSRGQ